MISATVIGNLGDDAELREVDDTSVLSFRIASNRFEKGEKSVDWVRCSFWGARAEKIEEYMTKGRPVAVRGSLTMRQYTTKSGDKGAALELRCDDVQLIGDGNRDDDDEREERGDKTERRSSSSGGGSKSSSKSNGGSSKKTSSSKSSSKRNQYDDNGDEIPF